MDNIKYFISIFPKRISSAISSLSDNDVNNITELRIRKNKALIIYINDNCYFLNSSYELTQKYSSDSIVISADEFIFICDSLCNNSYHTNMQSMVDGYITTKSSSRIGIASSAVYKSNLLQSVKDITSINIRIAHEYLGCSSKVLDKLPHKLNSIIVASPPNCGKTTFLRDYARLISNGYYGSYKKVSIIDERREIAGDFDVGVNTDVLVSFPKSRGIEMATRTLSPELIICDEIGSNSELDAIKASFFSGINFAVSVHLKDYNEISHNSIINSLISLNKFDFLVLLKSYTNDFEIIDISENAVENIWNSNA